jgi:hypothetical protein
MKNFYNKLSKSKKIIFLTLTTPIATVIGAIAGLTIGTFAVNFIPDKCEMRGLDTICQSSFSFMGLIGWEGSMALGFIAGAAVGLLVYLTIIYRISTEK